MNTSYDDVLRQALHAAAENIEPAADGLERIRARIRPSPVFSLATAAAWWSGVSVRLASWAEPAVSAALEFFWTAVDRFRPGGDSEHGRGRYGWLRPVAAMGTAIFVVAAGAFAVMTLPQATGLNSSALPWNTHDGSSAPAGTSGLNGNGSQLITGPSTTGAPGTMPGVPIAKTSCSPSGGKKTSTSPPPATSSSPPASSPPVSSPPATTPPATSPPVSDTPTSPPASDSTTPDPGSAITPTPSVVTPPAGSGTQADRQAGSMAQAAYVVPSKSLAPSPCASTKPTTKPKASASGPSALDAGRYAVGSGRQAPAGTAAGERG